MDFLRHCPQCGRRFHVVLVDKKLAQVLDKEIVLSTPLMVKMAPLRPVCQIGEGERVTIDTEQFQWTYKRKHCGHEWSEARTENTSKNLQPTTRYHSRSRCSVGDLVGDGFGNSRPPLYNGARNILVIKADGERTMVMR